MCATSLNRGTRRVSGCIGEYPHDKTPLQRALCPLLLQAGIPPHVLADPQRSLIEVPAVNEKLTPSRLERIRQDHLAGDPYAELSQEDIGLLLGEVTAAYNRGFAEGSGNEGAY